MNKYEIKNHAKTILTKTMKKSSSKDLPTATNAAFNVYSNSWATVIAIDVVDYQEQMEYYERHEVIKMLQSFTSTIIKIGKENDRFVSAYLNGDQVIICFSTPSKTSLKSIYETAVKINSFANHLFPLLLVEEGYDYEFKCGIGIWVSDDNSLIKYGEKGTTEESYSTIIGESINNATMLSDLANRGKWDKPILMNYTLWYNLKDQLPIDELESIVECGSIDDIKIYGCSLLYSGYDYL